jgi:hypothetical protein
MAVLRSDVIIPEIFTPYIEEAVTVRSDFLNSGVVQAAEVLNVNEGGDYVTVPNWDADLTGDAERLTDTSSLTPSKIGADKQVAPVLHRGRAWESRELAKLAAGSDPMAAIGNKVAAYITNQQQKDLLATLEGNFGALTSNSGAALESLTFDTSGTRSPMSPRHVAQARALLGDQGDKLTAVCVHSKTYYDLVERRAIDYVSAAEARITAATSNAANPAAFAGSVAAAYAGDYQVPFYMGLRVIVSDDVTVSGSDQAVYFFAPGAVGTGLQQGINTETDRDILAQSDAMAVTWHNLFHVMGTRYKVSTGGVNPTRATLATAANWERVFEIKNIGVVRGTVDPNF